jgi:hypothetical protein
LQLHRLVESSRLETVAVLCSQWFRSRSNKSSSRLEMGARCGSRKLARLNPREWSVAERAAPPFVAGGKVTPLPSLHMGGVQDRPIARVSLRERSGSPRSGPYPVIARTWTARSCFDRPPPNLPKIITIYASTSLREIQGLEACVHLGNCDENPRGPRRI